MNIIVKTTVFRRFNGNMVSRNAGGRFPLRLCVDNLKLYIDFDERVPLEATITNKKPRSGDFFTLVWHHGDYFWKFDDSEVDCGQSPWSINIDRYITKNIGNGRKAYVWFKQ